MILWQVVIQAVVILLVCWLSISDVGLAVAGLAFSFGLFIWQKKDGGDRTVFGGEREREYEQTQV